MKRPVESRCIQLTWPLQRGFTQAWQPAAVQCMSGACPRQHAADSPLSQPNPDDKSPKIGNRGPWRSAEPCLAMKWTAWRRYQAHDEQLYKDVEGVLELFAEACTLLHKAHQALKTPFLAASFLQQVSPHSMLQWTRLPGWYLSLPACQLYGFPGCVCHC